MVKNVSDKTLSAPRLFLEPGAGVHSLLNNRWIYHVLFWTVYDLFLCLIFYSAYEVRKPAFFIQFILFLPVCAAHVYFNIYILISDSFFNILKEVTKINAGGQEFDINLIKTDHRKTQDGFLMPYTTELSFPGMSATFVAKKIELNKDFDASIFDMPKN